jgi:hypothetical protein
MRTAITVTSLIYLLTFALTDNLSLHEAWRCNWSCHGSRDLVPSVNADRRSWACVPSRLSNIQCCDLIIKQDRPYTYNVTLRRFCATIVVVENTWELHILSVCPSLSYPACNEHAPYCRLWPVRPCNIFPHYLINGISEKKSYETQNVYFDLLYNFCLKHFSFQEELSEIW